MLNATTTIEMVSIEEFAERLKICRSTAYNWLAEGRLIHGQHVIRLGRVVRILWTDDLISHLLTISDRGPEKTPLPRLQRNGKGGRNCVAVDFDYLS